MPIMVHDPSTAARAYSASPTTSEAKPSSSSSPTEATTFSMSYGDPYSGNSPKSTASVIHSQGASSLQWRDDPGEPE